MAKVAAAEESVLGVASPVRIGFLVRRAALDHDAFEQHWTGIHADLVASLGDFRRFTSHYTQDHVERIAPANGIRVDGFSCTTQAPRDDPAIGFYESSDYPIARADEARFLDLDATTTGVFDVIAGAGERSRHKLSVLGVDARPDRPAVGVVGWRVLEPRPETVRSLGGSTPRALPRITELWAGDAESRERLAAQALRQPGTIAVVLLRERRVL